ncbi:MAG: hypothetical protein AABY64_09175 [Bdellovibrionota bacterium]
MKYVLVLIASLNFASCATPYQSSEGSLLGGFYETPLSETKYVVGFEGNGFTSRQKALSYAIKRAREVCSENGFQKANILDRNDTSTTVQTNAGNTNCAATSYGYTTNVNCQNSPATNVTKPGAEVTVECAK